MLNLLNSHLTGLIDHYEVKVDPVDRLNFGGTIPSSFSRRLEEVKPDAVKPGFPVAQARSM
jgi:hypothetical protein